MSYARMLNEASAHLKPVFGQFRRSIRGRLAFWVIVLSLAQMLLFGVLLYFGTDAALHNSADRLLSETHQEFAARVKSDGARGVVSQVLAGWPGTRAGRAHFVRLISGDNRVLADTPAMPPALAQGLLALQTSMTSPAGIKGDAGEFYRAQLFEVMDERASPGDVAQLLVATDATTEHAALMTYRKLLMALTITLMAGGATIAWVVTTNELRPLERISEATAAIETGSLAYRLPREGWPRELERLVWQMNAMLDRQQTAYERLRHYADDVAHEFRNPVNKMLLASEITLSRPRSAEQYREALVSNTEECQRLSQLVSSLLFLARAENAAMALQRIWIDVNSELQLLAHSFRPTANQAGVELKCVTDEPVEADVDPVLFQRAVSNLIANAIAHTPRGGSISLSGEMQVDRVVVKVIDTGEGVPLEARARIFDRFYRSERVRAGDLRRVGLGLSIAKSIVELHDGSIYLESEEGVGTKVTLYFPVPTKIPDIDTKKIA